MTNEDKLTDYRVTYTQKFMGKLLEDTYIKHQQTATQMQVAKEALYSDPCVVNVSIKEIKD